LRRLVILLAASRAKLSTTVGLSNPVLDDLGKSACFRVWEPDEAIVSLVIESSTLSPDTTKSGSYCCWIPGLIALLLDLPQFVQRYIGNVPLASCLLLIFCKNLIWSCSERVDLECSIARLLGMLERCNQELSNAERWELAISKENTHQHTLALL
jgi:hypothetical protein